MAAKASFPFHSLHREHRLVSKTLQALSSYAKELENDPQVSLDGLRDFVQFLSEFAELCHHVKEEDILLPELARYGFSWDTGPVQKVREDHQQERYLLSVLSQASTQEGVGREDRRQLVATLRAFVEFELNHIALEETQLLPSAIERLSDAELAGIDSKLDAFESERFGAENYARLTALAEALVERYGSPQDE